jgi:hypothetical protein
MRRYLPALLIIIASIVVWNGLFDILVTRGVKEYLYRTADHELGRGDAVTMGEIMGQTVRDAVVTSTGWAVFVAAAGGLAIYIGRRQRDV